MTQPWQGSTQQRNSLIAQDDVHYTTRCTERPHSNLLSHTQHHSVIQYALYHIAVLLLVHSALPQTHTAQLLIYLTQCRCAFHSLQ